VLRHSVRPLALAAFVVLSLASVSYAQLPPAEALLPNTTKAYISVPDVQGLVQAWHNTPVGRLLDDPEMQPFVEDIKKQLAERGAMLKDTLGLTVEEFKNLATGELSIAVVANQQGKSRVAVLVDVAKNIPGAQAQLNRSFADLARNGAVRRQLPPGSPLLAVFDVPAKGKRKHPNEAVYFIQNGLLGVSDDVNVSLDVLGRLANPGQAALNTLPAYQAVSQRAAQGAKGFNSHFSWFIDPIGLGQAVENDVGRRKGARDILKLVKNVGFDAIQSVGGRVTLAANQYGVIHHTAIFAPKPWRDSMNMLTFPNGGNFAPQPWVPNDVATYTSINMDVLKAFDNFGPIFDEVAGEGEKGVWDDVLKSLIEDPNGPQLDIRKELVAHLGQRATIIADNTTPVGPHSQRRLLAIDTVNEKNVAMAVDKAMQNDKSVKQHTFQDIKIYELVPEEAEVEALNIEHPTGKGAPANQQLPAGGANNQPTPNSAVAVANGHLFVASNIELLKKILAAPQAPKPLAADIEYRTIANEIQKVGTGKDCVQGFARNDQKWFLAYELFRIGKLPESDIPLAKILNALLNDAPPGELRKPRLDGHLLPANFQVVQKYLSVGGTTVSTETSGWFITGFTLNQQVPRAAQARRPDGRVEE
jgi:hypothetical protein